MRLREAAPGANPALFPSLPNLLNPGSPSQYSGAGLTGWTESKSEVINKHQMNSKAVKVCCDLGIKHIKINIFSLRLRIIYFMRSEFRPYFNKESGPGGLGGCNQPLLWF